MIIAWFFQKDQQSKTSFYSLIICSGPIAIFLHVIVGSLYVYSPFLQFIGNIFLDIL